MPAAHQTFTPLPHGAVRLLPGELARRAALNRHYMLSLNTESLLQNHYLEAGLWNPRELPREAHGGWESPTCQLRGHFLGHWLSAAAHAWANTADSELKGKADYIISELARCQAENGGAWCFSIPEKYLEWALRGKKVWAPHYTLHKTLMGLVDMASLGGNGQALEVLARAARWFTRFTAPLSRAQMDDLLDVETGGMLEAWADLYALTGEREHLELMQRYERPRLFDRLLAGEDALTNRHANTTIPEAHGAARAWEVTGQERYLKMAQAYWDWAVTRRGYYATGGQSSGEVWSPPFELATRLGKQTQEHCVVYNMMRLAEFLLRWTGNPAYADYIERNLVNGILAQQHPQTGQVAYYLPLHNGAAKQWGTPSGDFWCCHGTLLQAHTRHTEAVFYRAGGGLALAQWLPCEAEWAAGGFTASLKLQEDPQTHLAHRPRSKAYTMAVSCASPQAFTLKVRVPWWAQGQAQMTLNGQVLEINAQPGSFASLERTWQQDTLRVEFACALTREPLPDAPERAAFMDGPTVLAGLYEPGCATHPEGTLRADDERDGGAWLEGWRSQGGMRFIPLNQVEEQLYGVYFEAAG